MVQLLCSFFALQSVLVMYLSMLNSYAFNVSNVKDLSTKKNGLHTTQHLSNPPSSYFSVVHTEGNMLVTSTTIVTPLIPSHPEVVSDYINFIF